MAVEIHHLRTYLAMLAGSPGTRMFRQMFADVDGEERDILHDGELSCAFFVSSVLYHFNLIKHLHATVGGTLKDMKENGWRAGSVEKAPKGAILVWEPAEERGELHYHAGFLMGDDQALSNSTAERVPAMHHLTFDGKRKITEVYTHPFLTAH